MKYLIGSALIGSALLIAVPAQAEKVSFGASLPLTGGLATNGQKHQEGYDLCIDLINKSGGLLGEPATLRIASTGTGASACPFPWPLP